MASKVYLHNYRLSQNGSTFTVLATDYGQFTVSDNGNDSGGTENPNVLGDVTPDNFTYVRSSNNSTGSSVYAGRDTTSGDSTGSFVAKYSNGNQTNYFLYTDTPRQANSAVTFNPAQSTPICYAAGTRILTASGEVPVETLRVGDLAVTASGAHRPIRWIGHRSMDPRRHAQPDEAMPVRIAAGALGENRPARDLIVSPGHSICLDIDGEVLIPAIALVNGTTITQAAVESVSYWHVELDSHDLLIAEGQPAESYLDMGNRNFFGFGGVVSLGAAPDADAASRTHADFCRPFHGEGAVVEAARARLRRRARALGWRLAGREAWAEVHLEVDGRIVRPVADGLSAGFVLPAGAQEVWLVCPTVTPSAVFDSADERALGLCLSGLSLGGAAVALDDPRLAEGFYAPASSLRWTAGRARLPAALLDGEVSLRLDLFQPPLPRWVAPQAVEAEPRRHAMAKAA